MKQKQVTNYVEKLGQRYSQYLRLLASDTQVKGADVLLIPLTTCSGHGLLHHTPHAPSPTTSVHPSLRSLFRKHGQPWGSPDQLFLQVEAPFLPREYWELLGPPETPPQQPWSLPVLLQLGKQLAELLVQAVQMPRSLAAPQGSCRLIPVLYHVYSFRSYRQVSGPPPGPNEDL